MGPLLRFFVVVVTVTGVGCTGSIGDTLPAPPGPAQNPNDEPDFESGTLSPGEQTLLAVPRFVRLTHTQWENTIADLFHLDEPTGLARDFADDEVVGSYDNDYRRLQVGVSLWGDYQRAAETIAEQQTTSDALERWLPDLPPSGVPRRDAFIADVGRRIFRRALDADEIAEYAALYDLGDDAYQSGDSFIDGVRIVLEQMLQSPYLLYRAELSDDIENGAVRLSGFELASRLSFLAWNSMPDDELLAVAESGGLDTVDGLRRELGRLLDAPRAKAMLAHFHDQLYGLERATDLEKEPSLFPDWDKDRFGAAYLAEAHLFLENLALGGGDPRDFLVSDHTYVNADLARVYGLTGAYDDGLVAVDLPKGTRPGFLTRQGFLATNAKIAYPDPIHRGLFVNSTLLCRELSPPPGNNTAAGQSGVTNRQRIESVTGKGTCGEGCHATIINPPGFALESFDAIGALRTTDNGQPVDTSGRYTFTDGPSFDFADVHGLVTALADAPQYHRCFASHLVSYIYGREVLAGDMPLVDTLAARTLNDDASIRNIIEGIVVSRGFRYRALGELEVTP